LKDRLVSLDVFRGLTVALMILVNNPGSWAHIHPPLRHAAWHGLTPTDLVFPFFLFIVGAAVSLSFARRLEAGATRGGLVRKILGRSAVIFACGLFLNGFPFVGEGSGLDSLRIMGVLQRIALCYLAAGLTVVLVRGHRGRLLVMAGLVLAYELAMRLPLVPGWGAGRFGLADSFARWVDLRLLGEAHLYRTAGVAFDPEGLVSTLPAIVTTLLGFFAGEVLRARGDLAAKLRRLAVAGLVLIILGSATAPFEPVNKQLWTFSYVLITGGLALVVLTLCSWMIDVRGWRRGTRPAVVFGSNPLVVFVGSGLLARTLGLIEVAGTDGGTQSLQRAIYSGLLEPVAGPVWGSLLHALLHAGLWLAVAWWLWSRRIFVKV
jgi:predicted acyltransferase